MAEATNIVNGDTQDIAWMDVADSDGGQTRYHRRGQAAPGATVHVVVRHDRRLESFPKVFRQDKAGLPNRINVRFVEPAGPGWGLTGCVATWEGPVYEYETR